LSDRAFQPLFLPSLRTESENFLTSGDLGQILIRSESQLFDFRSLLRRKSTVEIFGDGIDIHRLSFLGSNPGGIQRNRHIPAFDDLPDPLEDSLDRGAPKSLIRFPPSPGIRESPGAC
jgi:hypothetical protein